MQQSPQNNTLVNLALEDVTHFQLLVLVEVNAFGFVEEQRRNSLLGVAKEDVFSNILY
jgi:hypothetical protein